MRVTIYINPTQAHQKDHARWLLEGFDRHGIRPHITSDLNAPGEVKIISGPHFGKKYLTEGHNVIMIDRCFYRGDPDNISMAWVTDGIKRFFSGSGRKPPEVSARPRGQRTIYLADHSGTTEPADTIRLHPANERHTESLVAALDRHDIAVGNSSTALVKAALMGLRTIARDTNHILNQPGWLNLLPYADWHSSDIINGEAWEFLRAKQWA